MKKEMTEQFYRLFQRLGKSSSLLERKTLLQNFPFKTELKSIIKWSYSTQQEKIQGKIRNPYVNCFKVKKGDAKLKRVLKIIERALLGELKPSEVVSKTNALIQSDISRKEIRVYNWIASGYIKEITGVIVLKTVCPEAFKKEVKFKEIPDYNANQDLEYPIMAEPYYGGIRLKMVIHPSGDIQVVTNANKSYAPFFINYFPFLEHYASMIGNSVEIEGELFYKNWRSTFQMLSSESVLSDQMKKDFLEKGRFYVYDLVEGNSDAILRRRKRKLLRLISKWNEAIENLGVTCIKMEVLPHKYVNNESELEDSFKNAISHGLDGIILRDPQSVYSIRDSLSWLLYSLDQNKEVGIIKELIVDDPDEPSIGCTILISLSPTEDTTVTIPPPRSNWFIDRKIKLIGKRCQIDFSSNPKNLTMLWET